MAERAHMSGWATHRFDEMATLVNERIDHPEDAGVDRYVGLEHLDPESLTIRRWGLPSDVTAAKLLFRKGDIIFGRRRVYQRKLAVADFDGICSAHAMVLRAKGDVVLPAFLPFFMQSDPFMSRALEISVGSLSPTINWKALAKQEFRLPSLEAQRRAVGVLAACRSAESAHRQVSPYSERLHRSLRSKLFALGAIGSTSSQRKLVNLGDVAEFLDSRRIPLKEADRVDRHGPYPYYGASGVIDSIDDYLFEGESLLVSEDGANLVDRSTPVAFLATGKYWVNNHAHVLRAMPPFSNFLLAEYIESLNLRPHLTGTAQPKLNKKAAMNIRVPRLSGEEIQHIERSLRSSVAAVRAVQERAAVSSGLLRAALVRVLSEDTDVQ